MSPQATVPTQQIYLGKRWNEQDDETCATEDITTFTCYCKYQPSKAKDINVDNQMAGSQSQEDSQQISTTFRHAARNLSEFRKMHVDFYKTCSILRPLHNAAIPKKVIRSNDMSEVSAYSTSDNTHKKTSSAEVSYVQRVHVLEKASDIPTEVVKHYKTTSKTATESTDGILLPSSEVANTDNIENEELSCEDRSQTQKRANVIAMIRKDFLAQQDK
uniref:Uncharacterized protein n=1 Tax=Chaetoceros debilis TaxID=122233 RepID=A0A7S3VG24_9STRA